MDTIQSIEQTNRKLKAEALRLSSEAKEAVSKAKSLKEQVRQAKAIFKEAKKAAKDAKRLAKQARKDAEESDLTLEAARHAQAEAKFNSIVKAHAPAGSPVLAGEATQLVQSTNGN